MTKNGIEPGKIQGVGISVPGTFDLNAHKLISPPLLKNWFDLDIPSVLTRKLKIKGNHIYVDNDANLGALGECRYGRGRGISDFIYVKVGVGIGSGIIKNGQLDRGSTGAAGEIGHVIVKYEGGNECGSCGKHGCLESVAGEHAIIEAAREGNPSVHRYQHLKRDSLHPQVEPDITHIIRAAKEGDYCCLEALRIAGRYIGTVLGSYVMNAQNPSLIIIDGDSIREGERLEDPILLDYIRKNAYASSLHANSVRVEVGELGEKAIALGAVAKVIENIRELTSPMKGSQGLAAV